MGPMGTYQQFAIAGAAAAAVLWEIIDSLGLADTVIGAFQGGSLVVASGRHRRLSP